MDFRTIFGDNIDEYSDLVDEDVAENMGRMFFHGLAGHDPDDRSLLSLLIWELKSVENIRHTSSELRFIYAADPSFISPLLEKYHEEVMNDKVKKTFFEITSQEPDTEEALSECGFSIKRVESRDIDVTVDECKGLPVAKKDAPPYIQSIDILDNQEFYQGLMNILFRYENPALEDLAYLPRQWYEQTVSCYCETDGKVTGLLLVHACPSGILIPVLFFSVGADYKMNLIEMLRFSIARAAEIYPGDTVIRIHRRNHDVNVLSEKFFPGRTGRTAVAGERSEKRTVQ